MATNKAKRSIHLAQHQHQPAPGLMPVKAHIYLAIAEWNGGLEEAMQSLKKLQQINFLPSSHLAAMYDMVGGLRAQSTRDLLAILSQRETANAGHFEHLRNSRKNSAVKIAG